MTIEEKPAETHFFLYNIHTFPSPLEPFSSTEFSEGEESFFTRHQYQRIPGTPEHIELYASAARHDKYMVLVRLPPYRFIFSIHDDASLLEWNKQYERIPAALLAQKFLPPPPVTPKHIEIQMNWKAIWKR